VNIGSSIALVCVLGLASAVSGLGQTRPPAGKQQPSPPPVGCVRGAAQREQILAGQGWRATIWLDRCVAEPDAGRILQAIHDKHLVNRSPEPYGWKGTGRRQDIPGISVSDVLGISIVSTSERQSVPEARYSVMTGPRGRFCGQTRLDAVPVASR
jgi:hypothetical protein